MRSTSRCADCWRCLTLLAPPDPASSGLDRVRVVSLRGVLFFVFWSKNPNYCLLVGIGTYQMDMCHEGNWLSRTDSFHSMTISSSWFDLPRDHFFLCVCVCCANELSDRRSFFFARGGTFSCVFSSHTVISDAPLWTEMDSNGLNWTQMKYRASNLYPNGAYTSVQSGSASVLA